jgi:hypothetical protein
VHEELFAQARTLALLDPRKPRQANLRRSVSSAYYAVFHFLVEEACCIQFGTQHVQAPFRYALGRAFTHSIMKEACTSFGGGTLKESVIKGLPRDSNGKYAVHFAIKDLAANFVELQEKRHVADYDRGERLHRSDVLFLLDEAVNRVVDFAAIPLSDEKKFFLACLWAWKELSIR